MRRLKLIGLMVILVVGTFGCSSNSSEANAGAQGESVTIAQTETQSVMQTEAQTQPQTEPQTKEYALLSEYVEEITYHSNYLDVDRPANIFFPCGYDPSIQYDVVYMLHGMSGNYDSYKFMDTLDRARGLITEYNLRPMILVSMTVFTDKDGLDESAYNFSSLAPKYDTCIDDIINCLIPYVNSHYSTNTGREHTGICGYSLGGREAMYLAYAYPEIFGKVGAFSPVGGVFEDSLRTKALIGDVGKDFKHPDTIVVVVGDTDPYCLKSSKQYDEYFTSKGVDHIFRLWEGGHETKIWKAGFDLFLQDGFAGKEIIWK